MNMTAAELHEADMSYQGRKVPFQFENFKLVFKNGVAVLAQRRYCWHCAGIEVTTRKGHEFRQIVRTV